MTQGHDSQHQHQRSQSEVDLGPSRGSWALGLPRKAGRGAHNHILGPRLMGVQRSSVSVTGEEAQSLLGTLAWGPGSRLRPQLQPLFSLSWTPTPRWMSPRPPPRWTAPGPGHSHCTTTPLPRLSPLNKPIEVPYTGQGCDLPPCGLPETPLREAFWLGR